MKSSPLLDWQDKCVIIQRMGSHISLNCWCYIQPLAWTIIIEVCVRACIHILQTILKGLDNVPYVAQATKFCMYYMYALVSLFRPQSHSGAYKWYSNFLLLKIISSSISHKPSCNESDTQSVSIFVLYFLAVVYNLQELQADLLCIGYSISLQYFLAMKRCVTNLIKLTWLVLMTRSALLWRMCCRHVRLKFEFLWFCSQMITFVDHFKCKQLQMFGIAHYQNSLNTS